MDSQDIRIWLCKVDAVDVSLAAGVLSAGELERAKGMASPLLRQRFLARRLLAREVLEEAGDEGPVCWSASSSGDLAAVAISPWRLGIDIERQRASTPPRWGQSTQGDDPPRRQRIANRFYTEAERQAIAGSPTRFLELWTMKEAYLKALGLGLAGGLDAIDCTTLSQPVDGWSTSDAHPGWRFRQLRPEPGFVGALAVEGSPRGLEVRRWAPNAAPVPRPRA